MEEHIYVNEFSKQAEDTLFSLQTFVNENKSVEDYSINEKFELMMSQTRKNSRSCKQYAQEKDRVGALIFRPVKKSNSDEEIVSFDFIKKYVGVLMKLIDPEGYYGTPFEEQVGSEDSADGMYKQLVCLPLKKKKRTKMEQE